MAEEFSEGSWGNFFKKPKNIYQEKVDYHQLKIDSYDMELLPYDVSDLVKHNDIAYHQSEINETIKRHPEYFI